MGSVHGTQNQVAPAQVIAHRWHKKRIGKARQAEAQAGSHRQADGHQDRAPCQPDLNLGVGNRHAAVVARTPIPKYREKMRAVDSASARARHRSQGKGWGKNLKRPAQREGALAWFGISLPGQPVRPGARPRPARFGPAPKTFARQQKRWGHQTRRVRPPA